MVRAGILAAILLGACGDGPGTSTTPVIPPAPAPAPVPAPEPVPVSVLADPTGIRVSEVGPDFVEWTWDPVDGAVGYDADVYSSGAPPDKWIRIHTEAPSYQWEDLPSGWAFSIRVRAVREEAGVVPVRGEWATGPQAVTAGHEPTGIHVSVVGPDFVEWTWDPVDGATGYDADVFLSGTSVNERTRVHTEAPSYRWEDLPSGEAARIFVRAVREEAGVRVSSAWVPGPGVLIFGQPEFDQQWWDELVFNAYDCPPGGVHIRNNFPCGPLEDREARILDFVPDIQISLANLELLPTMAPEQFIEVVADAWTDSWEQLTDRPYTGEIEAVPGALVLRRGLIGVWIDPMEENCGSAWLGANPGQVNVGGGVGVRTGARCNFLEWLLRHEFVHALGFVHTGPGHSWTDGAGGFSPILRFHAQLAYRTLERGQPYVADPR